MRDRIVSNLGEIAFFLMIIAISSCNTCIYVGKIANSLS